MSAATGVNESAWLACLVSRAERRTEDIFQDGKKALGALVTHAIEEGLRLAGGLSRRRCPPALSLDPQVIRDGVTEDEFVALREARDAGLAPPALLMPPIQVNIRAGRFPPAEANGVHCMMVPVKIRNPAAAAAIEPHH